MQVFDAAWVETTDQQAKQHEETLEHDLHQAKITQLKDNIRSSSCPCLPMSEAVELCIIFLERTPSA